MAFTEKLKSGRYRGGYWALVDGKRKKIWVLGTHARKSDAKDLADEEAVKARRQAQAATGQLSAKIHWGDWWDILAVSRVFDSDNGDNEASIVRNHLRPYWGDTPLNSIDNVAVQEWIDSYDHRRNPQGGRYKPASVSRFYSVFAVTINEAIRRRILTASPLAGIVLPKVPRRAKPYLALDEAAAYSKVLRKDYADALEFDLETGLRPGELAGLHDDQVDLRRKVLTARTVYVTRQKRMRDWPKDGDEREIPLTAKAIEIYRRRTAGRNMHGPCGIDHYDARCESDLVFRTDRGRPINPEAFLAALDRAAGKAGVARRTPYAARRGYATRLRDAGTDTQTIMELLGHSKEEQTHGYAQQGPEFQRKVLAALGDPGATGLQVVGQDQPRGTDRGTHSDEQALADARTKRRRKAT